MILFNLSCKTELEFSITKSARVVDCRMNVISYFCAISLDFLYT